MIEVRYWEGELACKLLVQRWLDFERRSLFEVVTGVSRQGGQCQRLFRRTSECQGYRGEVYSKNDARKLFKKQV